MRLDRLLDLIAIARTLRATSRLGVAARTTKMTLSRWARGRGAPSPAQVDGFASWLLEHFPASSPADVLAWLDGEAEPDLDEAAGAASARGTVRLLREVVEMTQAEAARRAGTSRQTWISWEARDDRGELPEDRRARAMAVLGNVSRR